MDNYNLEKNKVPLACPWMIVAAPPLPHQGNTIAGVARARLKRAPVAVPGPATISVGGAVTVEGAANGS